MADGRVRNRKRAEQGRDYSGMKFGTITPSDIDGFMDFGGRLFVFIELKLVGAPFERGQKWAYERLVDACERVGIPSIVIVARHTTPDDQLIPAASCVVSEFRIGGRWREPKDPSITLRAMVDLFVAYEAIPWSCDEPPVHQGPLDFDAYDVENEPILRLVRRS